MIKTFKTLPLIILIVSSINLSAQEKNKIISKGSFSSNSLSRDKIKQEAIKNAKVNALRQAGISEKVGSVTISFNSEINEDLLQIFEETTTIETKGEIIVDTVLNTDFIMDEFQNLTCNVEIESTIYKYDKERDASFDFEVKGIKESLVSDKNTKLII